MCATMAGQDKCIRDKGENMAKIIVNNENKKSTIAPEIYGHFSEHLGRCIYEGLFVGENSDIPNVNGMRTDVVDALKEMKIPVLRWPGGGVDDVDDGLVRETDEAGDLVHPVAVSMPFQYHAAPVCADRVGHWCTFPGICGSRQGHLPMLRMRWRACLRFGSRGHGSAGSMACGQRSDPALGLPQISHTFMSK